MTNVALSTNRLRQSPTSATKTSTKVSVQCVEKVSKTLRMLPIFKTKPMPTFDSSVFKNRFSSLVLLLNIYFELDISHNSKRRLCRQKSKFVLFPHEIIRCKTFQMTYYLFIYDVPNRSCVILKCSSVQNYIGRKRH